MISEDKQSTIVAVDCSFSEEVPVSTVTRYKTGTAPTLENTMSWASVTIKIKFVSVFTSLVWALAGKE